MKVRVLVCYEAYEQYDTEVDDNLAPIDEEGWDQWYEKLDPEVLNREADDYGDVENGNSWIQVEDEEGKVLYDSRDF